ncbi:MAG: sulfatase-like hydrolase/transferase, partial [Rubripirellula sp.]|nr:sulfatase-like hydrolase/transferase [Rubripirellula sp.]
MKIKNLPALCLLTLSMALAEISVSQTAAADGAASAANDVVRPDIVIFLSDDHTWRDSSVYGSPDIKTPNMQRIADAGMTFDNAFVASPSCAPSRAALLTGLYPARNGAEPNHSRPRADVRKLPAYFQELGYEVAAFGKVAHYRHTPEYGFDVARHFGYHDDVAIDAAIEWLEERESSRPLCLLVGTNWPHVPWPEDVSAVEMDSLRVPPNHVDTEVTRDWRAKYVAAVRTMDDELGKVYDAAHRKFGDKVFFLHSSDHGAQWPFGKWSLYDDGIRTPLIVSWPGKIAEGQRSTAMVSWIDVLPTLLDIAGEPSSSDFDGRSFRGVLEGQTNKHREAIFTTHSGDGNHNVFPIRSIRTADGWKYIRNLHPEFRFGSHVTEAERDRGYWASWLDAATEDQAARTIVNRYQSRPAEELYNTQADPYEQANLISDSKQQGRLAELRGRVDDWLAETDDPQTVFGTPRFLAAENQPNIITVFIDDMGWSDLSCFGGKGTTTENIDRLASEGLRFTNFYVNSPICSPSRVALTTGQYPQRHRITSYLANRRQNRSRGMAQWLDAKSPTLARSLQQAGYATGHFGKWHMGGQRDVGNAPLIRDYGFDRSLTNFEGLGPRILPLKDAYDGKSPKKHDLGSAALGRGTIRWEDRSKITTAFVDETLEFIDHAQVTGQPFFVNVWPDDVHSPFFPPKVLRSETDESKRELYYAVLDAMDQQLGKLFDRVREDPTLRENTLILVMSDNGHEDGAGSSDPLRGSKSLLYEGGIRSPLIVWGPAFLAEKMPGVTNSESILCALDINRSLYSFAGINPDDGVQLDGQDVMPTLLGESMVGRREPIFWRRPPDRPGTAGEDNPDLAVRDGR